MKLDFKNLCLEICHYQYKTSIQHSVDNGWI